MGFRGWARSPSRSPGSPFESELITDLSTSCAIHCPAGSGSTYRQCPTLRGARAPRAYPASLPGKSRFAARSGWPRAPAHLTINPPGAPPYGPPRRERTTFPQGFTLSLGKIKKIFTAWRKTSAFSGNPALPTRAGHLLTNPAQTCLYAAFGAIHTGCPQGFPGLL